MLPVQTVARYGRVLEVENARRADGIEPEDVVGVPAAQPPGGDREAEAVALAHLAEELVGQYIWLRPRHAHGFKELNFALLREGSRYADLAANLPELGEVHATDEDCIAAAGKSGAGQVSTDLSAPSFRAVHCGALARMDDILLT